MTFVKEGFSRSVTVIVPAFVSLSFFQPARSVLWAPRIETSNARGNRRSSERPERFIVASSPNVRRPSGSVQNGSNKMRSSGWSSALTISRATVQSDSGTTSLDVCFMWRTSSARPTSGTAQRSQPARV